MRDTFGIVPDFVRANIAREEAVDRAKRAAVGLDQAVKALDERLSIVYVKEGVDPRMMRYGVKPGRFHVCRRNDPPAADTYMPIETPDGGFREPDSGVLDELRARDSWHGAGRFPKIATKYRHGLPYGVVDDGGEQERKDKLADEQRRDEIKADYRAALRVPGEGGLSKRKWGRGNPR